jgi:hypothetical protein
MPYSPPVGTADLALTGSYTPPIGVADLPIGKIDHLLTLAGESLAPVGALRVVPIRFASAAGESLAPTGLFRVTAPFVATGTGESMKNWIYVAEVTVWNADTESEETYYFSSVAFVSRPLDTPAHTAFLPRIQQPALLQRSCFSKGATGGESRVGYGELVLVNDGVLDGLIDRGFDGRRVVIRYGSSDADYPSAWKTVLTGTMASPGWETMRLALRIRDRLAELDTALQTVKYLGNNSLPNGLEGVVDDLKDRPKPLCYGTVYNIPAILVNSSKLIYQVHDGAIQALSAVYDQGAALTAGAAYSSQSEMETTAPSAGHFRAWLAGGYFRLGSTPAGLISANVTQGATAGDRTTAQVLKALALQAGLSAGEISSEDVAALDVASSAEIGVWWDQEITALAAMNAVAEAAGAWYGFDDAGILRMAQLQAPSGTPVMELSSVHLVSLEVQTTADGANAVPVWRVEVHYAVNYSVQTSDLAGSVTAERRGWLKQASRVEAAEDPDVQTAHPLSEPLIVETPLISQAVAASEAARRLAMFGVRRDRVNAVLRWESVDVAALTLGAVVRVTYARYGYTSGRLLRILAVRLDLKLKRAELTLWG